MSKNIIILNRGDTLEFDLTIEDDNAVGGRYILKDKDTVFFGVMDPHQPFEDALIKKMYTTKDIDSMGNLVIRLDPDDTLDLLPGVYYYAIKLHCKSSANLVSGEPKIDKVITVINKTKFILND